MRKASPPPRWLPQLRFWLGLNLVLFAIYMITPLLSPGSAGLTPRGMLESFLLTGFGLTLGLLYARYWPLPERPGFASIIRSLLLTIPALGFSLALGLLFQPQVSALTVALAAFLGAHLKPAHKSAGTTAQDARRASRTTGAPSDRR